MTTSTTLTDLPVVVEAREAVLHGDLSVPDAARGLVLFAHGSGSSRRSVRNRAVANTFRHARLATLLMDLLTEAEEAIDIRTRTLRFDIDLLAGRVAASIDWVVRQPPIAALPIGLFGASTGAAAALIAAVTRRDLVRAVVSRGGRPDLAGDNLRRVKAPTLLIVGGADPVVLDLNRRAYAELGGKRELAIVAGATHLFEEQGTLDEVARLASGWFTQHLVSQERAAAGMRSDVTSRETRSLE